MTIFLSQESNQRLNKTFIKTNKLEMNKIFKSLVHSFEEVALSLPLKAENPSDKQPFCIPLNTKKH
jgi:hypothetical protein